MTLKLVDADNSMFVSIQGKGYFLTLAQGHLHMKIKTFFFSETVRPFLTKFCMKAFRYKSKKIYQHDARHITKMATLCIYGKKPFINLLSRNQWDDFNETLYEASGNQVHHGFLK